MKKQEIINIKENNSKDNKKENKDFIIKFICNLVVSTFITMLVLFSITVYNAYKITELYEEYHIEECTCNN